MARGCDHGVGHVVTTYLDKIIAFHRDRASRDERLLEELIRQAESAPACRPFTAAINDLDHLAVIAEVKRRSPSKGDLNVSLDPAELARSYERGGASCVSVLTDERHFGGSASDLRSARNAVTVPVLRKDFTVDARDVCDARIMGADCVLLIAAALTERELSEFLQLSDSLGMDSLVEVHDEAELERAVNVGAALVGVNQRDLLTFEVDHERAVRMGAAMPADVTRVAESGVRGRDDAQRLWDAGYHAVLVGEHLVTSAEPAEALAELLVR